ncbi:nucleoside-diphosphate-sugar epimerase [Thermobacillus composti KWC4]|uniref:Nucleoside-diphosphate-sugar epimerase n=1 Tax=Thermobacillus composti (strain DSM 18247 / JCM 13945 / KWC4) TaxID=717605 RepID=L0EDH6_THECK|nr:SDR family oxidoreductase [Thermobacillus composti]AGA57827.1 nucleoside-diphosphate-sugar epimerase [Thermobacillus composti KWC4]
MKLLFIGGTGLISQAVSRLVISQGHELYLFNRGRRQDFVPEGEKVIEGDIRDAASAAEALRGHEWDVVVDWIVFTPEQARADIELFRGRTKQYVFISSASAYQKPLRHYIITESTPLENPYWQYSRDKIACEKLLMDEHKASGFLVTIVRPSYTYGDTMIPAAINSWEKPWSIVDRMRRGKPVIVHGDGTSLWTMTHNTDFAVGFAGLLGRPEAIGEAYHITSDEVLTWNQIYEAIGRAAGIEPKLVHIASDFIISHWPDMEGGLLGDKAVSAVFDNSKIRALVPEFKPKVPFAEGIQKTIAWFEAAPERCAVDEEWNARCDRLIEAHERARTAAGG